MAVEVSRTGITVTVSLLVKFTLKNDVEKFSIALHLISSVIVGFG
jgi:hypothetical protein